MEWSSYRLMILLKKSLRDKTILQGKEVVIMDMIAAGDFRKGVTIELDGQVYTIVDFQHVKPGKGAAFVRTKIKNIVTGNVLERTFNPTEKVPRAHIETKEMQYLYNDGNLYYFMDTETYEQIPLNREQVEDAMKYIKENMIVTIKFYKGVPFTVEPPNFVELKVIDTEPGVRGDTVTGGSKPATLETGAVIQVPLFINTGDVIRIDTRTDEYIERV
jgi:translation elongation factor P